MKAVVIDRFGRPEDVARCVDRPDPPAPGAGEVRLRVAVATINPADLLLIEGTYGQLPPLPAIPGAECVAHVEAVGGGVTGISPGDVVVPMMTSCWRELITTKAAGVVALPRGVDLAQAAMLKANPATALVMIEDMVTLQPGDWVIQNAGNSAVARYVAKLARQKGLRTISIVRRPELVETLQAEGADAAMVDDWTSIDDLVKRVGTITEDRYPRLALDAIGGSATGALAAALGEGGTVVSYGVLGGQASLISPRDLIFRGINVRGFWLAQWFRMNSPERVRRLYQTLVRQLSDGNLSVPVDATYPFSRIGEALAHAARAGRAGKIQLVPG